MLQVRGQKRSKERELSWHFQMIVNHFFVDGAGHICLAWGVCQPKEVAALIGNKQPRPWVTLCIYNLFKPQSVVCQVHLSWVCRGYGDGASLHDWPPVDLRVHRLPRAELLCGQQQPSLHWHGERLSFTDSWPYQFTTLRSRIISPPCTPWPWISSSSLRIFATSTSQPVAAPSPPCKQSPPTVYFQNRQIYVIETKTEN